MTLYESTERYLKGPDGMRNEVDMWYSGACLLFQEIIRKKQGKGFGGLHEQKGIDIRRTLEPVSVLDVCCGPGNFANYVGLFYPEVDLTGIDINDEFLRSARERFGEYGWTFLRTDAVNFNLGRTFDFILASSAYHHIEDREKIKFLQSIRNHLSEDGKVIVCDNFLPYHEDDDSRREAIHQYYNALIRYYSDGNATLEAIEIIKEVYQLELEGEEEHKVHFQRFKEDIEKSGLEIEVDRVIWQPEQFRADNAGSHVLILKRR